MMNDVMRPTKNGGGRLWTVPDPGTGARHGGGRARDLWRNNTRGGPLLVEGCTGGRHCTAEGRGRGGGRKGGRKEGEQAAVGLGPPIYSEVGGQRESRSGPLPRPWETGGGGDDEHQGLGRLSTGWRDGGGDQTEIYDAGAMAVIGG